MTFRDFRTQLITWEDTLSRGDFWCIYWPLAIVQVFIQIPLALTASRLLAWALASLSTFIALATLFQILKRLSNTGRSRWFTLLLLIPFANVYVIYLLFIKKGSHAP